MTIQADASPERRAPLTRERVLQAAVELADRGGIEAISMRKLGQELGVEAMALYRHVRGKDDLLDGIVEVVLGEIAVPEPTAAWKPALRAQIMAARRVMVRHPWASRLLEERGTGGPAFLAYLESVLANLIRGGFTLDLAHHALHVMGSRVFGFSQDILDDSRRSDPAVPPPPPPPGLERYPTISRLASAVSHEGGLGYCDDDVEFEFALDLILDGLDRRRAAT